MPKDKSIYRAPNRETFVKGKLRQASLRWNPRSEALRRARVDRGLYECKMCEQQFKSHQVHLDHIESVIPLKPQPFDWNSFITRLFCDVEGFQVLCTNCHDAKTKLEDEMRMHYKHGNSTNYKRNKK